LATDATILHPPGKPMWRVRDGSLGFVDKVDLDGKRGIVLLVPPGEKVDIFAPYLSMAKVKIPTQGTNDLRFLSTEDVRWIR
jgi:hypothetical protein